MCIAVPGRVAMVRSEESCAELDVGGARVAVSTVLLDGPVLPGDYVLAHAGYAIARIDTDDALRTLALWDEINGHSG